MHLEEGPPLLSGGVLHRPLEPAVLRGAGLARDGGRVRGGLPDRHLPEGTLRRQVGLAVELPASRHCCPGEDALGGWVGGRRGRGGWLTEVGGREGLELRGGGGGDGEIMRMKHQHQR